MAISAASDDGPAGLIRVEDAQAPGRFVILCDHASNRVPPGFGDPGISAADMQRHIAWDPGALPVARSLARQLAAPLVYPDASRLLIDCNRPPTAPDSMPVLSEDTPIPGNRDLAEELRARRIRDIYDAYHAAIEAVIEARTPAPTALVAVHSFTPVYRGRSRPWHVGLVVAEDRRLADPLFAALRADAALVVGENQPYAPTDGVYHTLERHAGGRGIPAVMIEIRNDQIATPETQEAWASRLAAALADAI